MLKGTLVGWFAVALVAYAGSARSEDWLSLSLYSYHFAGQADLTHLCGKNQRVTNCTPGIGWEHDLLPDLRSVVHVYSNSNRDASFDAALSYAPVRIFDNYRLGVLLGRVTGYQQDSLRSITFGGLTFTYERRGKGVNAIFIPAAGGVLHLQYKEAVKFLE